MRDARHYYIDGEWVAPLDGRDFAVVDPSTEEAFATIALGGDTDADAAVAAAKAAFPAWSATAKAERLAALERLLAAYREREQEMAQIISEEMGAPISFARAAQAAAGVEHLEDAIAVLKAYEFEREFDPATSGSRIVMEPIGVCALITPWNWPMNQVTLKVAPALAAGCTVVLKPSEVAPLSSHLFAEMVHAAEIPAGVFNMVDGDGEGVGTRLSTHPDVDMVSFTGSTRAGRAITKGAADTIKRVTLELGGKGANIVFADADEQAVARGASSCFNNTGQSCNAPTRMLVERSRYDEAVETAARVAQTTEVAPAGIDSRQIGPLVSELQWERVQAYIGKGIDEGARLVAGGQGRPDGLNRGYFVKPTVFADVTPDMTIWREEIFGPVLSLTPFDDEAEALELANDTEYGLTHYLQTSDSDRARRVARALRSGMVVINGGSRGFGAPFGGYRQSGNGREGGIWGLEEFLEVKSIGGWF